MISSTVNGRPKTQNGTCSRLRAVSLLPSDKGIRLTSHSQTPTSGFRPLLVKSSILRYFAWETKSAEMFAKIAAPIPVCSTISIRLVKLSRAKTQSEKQILPSGKIKAPRGSRHVHKQNEFIEKKTQKYIWIPCFSSLNI